MSKIQAFILAGGRSRRLGVITKHRSKSAVPFGGRYRIIDFTLSNCVNSRIQDVQVATQYAPRSLENHVRLGRPWDLDRRDGGVVLLRPYTGREDSYWYRGTADALYRNLDILTACKPSLILVLSGDQVYRMDYGEMIRQHRRNNAKVTMAVKPVDSLESKRFGMVGVDGSSVTRFEEKPNETDLTLANLAVYLFDARYLVQCLETVVAAGRYDIVWDVVIPAVQQGNVAAYIYDGYWEDVGEIDAYYNASLNLLPASSEYLWDRGWPIYTRSEERPPAKFGPRAEVDNSIIANGCRVFGRVERSILFPGTLVGEGSLVRDSILFSEAQIHAGVQIRRCILDKRVTVGDGVLLGCEQPEEAIIGRSPDGEVSVETREGLTVVGKDTSIPAHFECRRPLMIDSHMSEAAVRKRIEV